jgi:outer membrane protein OmpA-like peptidoglycan-associated protein
MKSVALCAVVLSASACEGAFSESAMPSSAQTSPAPAPAAPTAAVSAPTTANYGVIETFRSADPGYDNSAQGRINGLTPTSGNPNAQENGAMRAPVNNSRLVTDTQSTLASGGSVSITVTGNTDSRSRNTTNTVLGRDRAEVAARELARDMGLNPATTVLPVGAPCSGSVCIYYQGNPGLANGSFNGRNATATATFTQPALPLTPSGSARGGSTVPSSGGPGSGSSGSSGSGSSGSGGSAPAPSWNFELPSVNVTPNPGATPPPATPDFYDFYSGVDVDGITLNVVASVPDPFIVGGLFRIQDVKVTSVSLSCSGASCSGPESPRLHEVSGTWTLPSQTSYTACSALYRTGSGCRFLITAASPLKVPSSSGGFTGGTLSAVFYSATPAGVTVKPELRITTATVRLYEPVWVGGTGCDSAKPAKTCWNFVAGSLVDVPVRVTSTTGESFAKGSQGYYVPRRVVGSVGS